MSELDQILNNNELLKLSLFAKSCNLISANELDKIIEGVSVSNVFNNQNINSPLVLQQKTANSKIFDKYELEAFKNYINDEVLRLFFELLTQDPDFASVMAQTVYDIAGGATDPENLRQVILEKTSGDINLIAADIASGKKISIEEIKTKLKASISSKRKEIAQETNNNTKKTDPNGLSSATVFPKLAFKQKYRGLRWRPIKGATISPKALEKVQKTTKKIKKSLEQLRSGVRKARAFVSLLKKLESVYSNGLIGILSSVSKIVFSYFRDIGSTGVYVLDMTSPYIYYNLGTKFNGTTEEKAKSMQNEFLNSIRAKRNISTYEYMNRDINNSTPFLSDYVMSPEEEAFAQEEKKVIDFINSLYRPTNYSSFIKTIADAFMDDGDIPNYQLINIENGGLTLPKTIKPNRKEETSYISKIGLNNVRPGRPIFGKGSNATVVIVAFSMPNIFNITTMTYSTLRSFITMLYILGKELINLETINFTRDNHPFMKRLNRVMNKITSNKLYDYYSEKPQVSKNGDRYEVNAGATSQDPDFYGIAVRNIYPKFFEGADIIEAYIDKFLKNFKSSLSKELDNILKNLEELIDDIEDFIDKIDEVLSFFEMLKSMGLYTLSFTSNGGNEDIVEKLMTAEGFPGVAEGDKLRLIGGIVYCYGMPNPKPANIDFSGMVKQQMAAANYEAAVAKYESSGEAKDDPGSLDSFFMKEKIGENYSSSLDKIFKKLF